MFRNLYLLSCGRCIWGCYRKKLHTSTCQVLYSFRDKDFPNPNLPTPVSRLQSAEPDLLLEQLRKAKSVPKVLEMVSLHLDVMNSKHIVTCMDIIHAFLKNNSELGPQLLQDHTFQALCTRLMKTVRFMDTFEIITIYKTLTALDVRSNTYVMKCVLKMIGSQLNDMTLNQLTFLNYLLSKQGPNSLVDGLKLALPLVLQVQIDQQLDSDDMNEVVDCLQIACKSRLKPATIQKIVNTILQKTSVLTPDNAVSIIFAFLNLEVPVDGYKEILKSAFDVVSRNVDQLSEKQLTFLIRTCRGQSFYHSPFLFAATKRVISDRFSLSSTYDIMCNFNRLNFCPSDFKDFFTEMICAESELLRRDISYSPLNCTEFLTASGYQPSRILEAFEVLCFCSRQLTTFIEKYPYLYIKFVCSVSTFGYFPHDMLSKVLEEDFLYESWSQSKKQGRAGDFEKSIFNLLWSLEIYNQLDRYKIPESLVKKLTQGINQRNLNFECSLTKFLEVGLGGSQFVLSGVLTHDGHIIDHILAMRSGNYPVALPTSNFNRANDKPTKQLTPLENIALADDAKIVAVIVGNETAYCKDPEVLNGWMDLKVRNLAFKKYNPVVINYALWRNLPDREKIPYLMREIKEAVSEDAEVRSNLTR
ncbi:LOW QUALITY PROTEIN: uncharacterized protein LOC129222588 [Uloborus diversus]|uniref:LOW QUALITY PROTEIN: uncharacterized protein LOC129222588 n=1 Tax=Uloborus diversus TaxID=327109 RepID=UPI0024097509|nr:LOW QUALITY PROTEIN: uncharacterized protein LOC129222588 [Uloborus diversus]